MEDRIKHREEDVYAAVLSGEFEIDSGGCVWRIGRRYQTRSTGEVRIAPVDRRRAENRVPEGYLQVRVMIGGVRYTALAHRLVWRHFKGSIPGHLTVNHKDGKKDRNHPDNLELATYSEQQIHARVVLKRGRLDQSGSRNAMVKLSPDDVVEVRRLRSLGMKLRDIADRFHIREQTVSKIVRGERWKVKD